MRWTAIAMMGLCGGLAYAQHDASQLRLQVLNGKTGKPVVHVKVRVDKAPGGVPDDKGTLWVNAETDGEGYIMLPEATPTPGMMFVHVLAFLPCSRTNVNGFVVQKMAAAGTVSENACKPRITLYPQAGTLVFFVRPETWLDRLRK